jgi:hypothetical protein
MMVYRIGGRSLSVLLPTRGWLGTEMDGAYRALAKR